MELFKIEHLTFTYPEQENPAINDMNLTIAKGDFFVLCGHSGCGKTTFLRALKPAIAPHGTKDGAIYFKGTAIEDLDEETMIARIGFVMQSPESQVVTDKVWHELAFGLESLGYDTPTIRRRCAEMAAFFGIENWYYKKVSELSGGQKQLLSLAAVMTMQPEILILDEPTAQLDPIAASEFLGTLGKINRELGTTILLSEHRLEEALSLANKAAVIERGRILCDGSVDEVGRFLKENKNDMFAAMPCAMRIWGSVESALPCPVTVNEGRLFLNEYVNDHPVRPLSARTFPDTAGGEVVHAEEVWFRYEKNLPDVVKNLELSVYQGELFCILGGNGSGKTTTLKILAGLLKPYRGDLNITGSVGMLPQDPQTIFLKKTVREDLEDILKLIRIPAGEWDQEVAKIAGLCQIKALLDRHPYDLSGGEQQRAALAKILLLSPDILLLDEPTKGMDVLFKQMLAEILGRLKTSGTCIIMVSHDIEFCAMYADRCGLFFDGHLVTVSKPSEFFAGNNFYTTAANRMVREIEPKAVTAEEVIDIIGGDRGPVLLSDSQPEGAPQMASATVKAGRSIQGTEAVAKTEEKKLPLWRMIGAIICAAAALGVFIYSAVNGSLTKLVDKEGVTGLGGDMLLIYGIFIGLLILVAVFIGKRSKPPVQMQPPVEKRKLSRRTIIAAVLVLLCVPITLFFGVIYLERKQYYITALLILLECMIPFFLVFEGRKPKARELVIIATLCAMGIAGRAAFFMLPQFKPVMAIAIIAGVALGGETGFLVGAVTMLVSNIIFAQGPWTPWQMFAMGIIGFLAGVFFRKGFLVRSRKSLCIFGVICSFVIYGGIMNPAAALIWGSESLNFKILLGYYVTGFPSDVVHACATALFLWFGADPMLQKLDRIKIKYGLLE